jgi:nucleotide-binding universal stress UspA family protein
MIALPDSILLATDGSMDAEAAAHAAGDLAGHTGAVLHVLHVRQRGHLALPGEAGEATGEDQTQAVLTRAAAMVRGAGATAVVGRLREGRTADQVLAMADQVDAGLVVLGSRGLGAVQRAVVGSTSEAVVHHSTRPVLVVRAGRHAWPPERVVIGDDASVDARRAGDLGASIGHMFGTAAVVVRALSRLPRMLDGGAALIAVGTRGLGPVQRWRFGSVSTDVLRGAPGAVLINAHPH